MVFLDADVVDQDVTTLEPDNRFIDGDVLVEVLFTSP